MFVIAEPIVGVCLLVLGVVLLRIAAVKRKRFTIDLQKRTDVAEDFDTAVNTMKGRVKLGQRYVFGKWSGRLIAYDEIKECYFEDVYVYRNESYDECGRKLRVALTDSKKVTLASIGRASRNDDVKVIFSFLQQKNPNIKIRY